MFDINNDYNDYVFKCLCKQRVVAIYNVKDNNIIAIIAGRSYNAIIDVCSKSQNDYAPVFLSDIPVHIRHPFLDDAVICIAGNMIRRKLKELVEGWTV